MVLNDLACYKQVLGCLMKKPALLTEYHDIKREDFGHKLSKIIFTNLSNMYQNGMTSFEPMEVDLDVANNEVVYTYYQQNGGLDFVKDCYEVSRPENFDYYYNRLKKLSLLRVLKKNNYDISDFFRENFDTAREENEVIERFDEATVDSILCSIEAKFNEVKADFVNGGKHSGDAADGLKELVQDLKKSPEIGPELCGDLFSTACRGARKGKYYLRSSGSGNGKTRTAVFDACKIAFPIHWSFKRQSFVKDVDTSGNIREPYKTLFITTEMAKDEIQTIVLAYLSGVNEAHILVGDYDIGEEKRVMYAAEIVEKYRDYFYIEEISDPNLTNIEAMIKKYATIEEIDSVFYDYVFSSPSLVAQFSGSRLREDVTLMMLSNQLKQLAKDYNIFIFSSTQVNANAMTEEGFKDESCIRGSRAIVDKADMGSIMSRVDEKDFNSIRPKLKIAARDGALDEDVASGKNLPTHVIDIYKMRRGQYKNVRIWFRINLGTGEREDLFMTRMDNTPFAKDEIVQVFKTSTEELFNWRSECEFKSEEEVTNSEYSF